MRNGLRWYHYQVGANVYRFKGSADPDSARLKAERLFGKDGKLKLANTDKNSLQVRFR